VANTDAGPGGGGVGAAAPTRGGDAWPPRGAEGNRAAARSRGMETQGDRRAPGLATGHGSVPSTFCEEGPAARAARHARRAQGEEEGSMSNRFERFDETPDPELARALAALDPGALEPAYWSRFEDWVMASAGPALARRRAMSR